MCSGRADCKDSATLNNAVNLIQYEFLLSNYYFDMNDYSNPVKNSIDDKLKFYALQNLQKDIEIRVRKNEVIDQNSPMFYVPSDQYNFFSIGETNQNLRPLQGDTKIASIKIVLDSNYQIINRQVYSLGDIA